MTIDLCALCMVAAIAATNSSQAGAATPGSRAIAEPDRSSVVRVADLAWLSGRWLGGGFGGTIDEVWSEPVGGAMVGHFRLVKNGKAAFYEIMTLMETDHGVELRLKHVNPDMTGWEDKGAFVTFKLLKHDSTGAYFDGLTFRRVSADLLEVVVALGRQADGSVREEKLVYRRSN